MRNDIKAQAFGINQLFWNKAYPSYQVVNGEEIDMSGVMTALAKHFPKFASNSMQEIICRRLLTDTNIQLSTSNSKMVPFCTFAASVRSKPLDARRDLFSRLSGKDALSKFMTLLPKFVVGNQMCSSGWEFVVTSELTTKQKEQLVKQAMAMSFLVDDPSIAVMKCLGSLECGNIIDLPWNAQRIIKELQKASYPVTSIANWMYAQTIPYVDNSMFISNGVLLSMSPSKETYVLNSDCTGYWKLPFVQFRPAYERGYLSMDLDPQAAASMGWEGVLFNG